MYILIINLKIAADSQPQYMPHVYHVFDCSTCCVLSQFHLICRNASSEDRRLIIKKRKEVKKLTRELHSLRMDMLYRLSLAKYVSTLSVYCVFL